MYCILRASLWLTLTALFSLLQIVLIFTNAVYDDQPLPINEIYLSGALLFFSTGLVSSTTIDFFLSKSKKKNINNSFIGIFFTLFPIIILIASTFVYGKLFGKTAAEVNIDFIRTTTISIVVMALFLTLSTKTFEYLGAASRRPK